MDTIKLISRGDGFYETEDGRTLISRDDAFETECDEPHPMRISSRVFASYSAHHQRHLESLGARQKGRNMVWLCPGDETHFYTQWTVRVDGEWTDAVHDTFTEARAALESIIGPVTLQRTPKASPAEEPTSTEPGTGRRTWTVCGHPAERDAFDGCYVCHRPLVPLPSLV